MRAVDLHSIYAKKLLGFGRPTLEPRHRIVVKLANAASTTALRTQDGGIAKSACEKRNSFSQSNTSADIMDMSLTPAAISSRDVSVWKHIGGTSYNDLRQNCHEIRLTE